MSKITIKDAVALKAEAYAYPRQGAGWPATPAEHAAQAIVDAAGVNDLGRTPDEEAAVVAYYAEQSDARKADANAKAAAREAFLAAHATPDVVAFVRATQPVTAAEIMRHTGASHFAIKCDATGRNAPLDTTNGGLSGGSYIVRQGRR